MTLTRFMQFAENASLRSPDTKTKVGAVLIHPSVGVVAEGFNREIYPGAVSDWEGKEKHPLIIHAEMTAIMDYFLNVQGIPFSGLTLYVTLSPCPECTKLILSTGLISEVVYKELHHSTNLNIFHSAGLKTTYFS